MYSGSSGKDHDIGKCIGRRAAEKGASCSSGAFISLFRRPGGWLGFVQTDSRRVIDAYERNVNSHGGSAGSLAISCPPRRDAVPTAKKSQLIETESSRNAVALLATSRLRPASWIEFAPLQRRDLARILVDAGDRMAEVRETRRKPVRHTRPNHCDALDVSPFEKAALTSARVLKFAVNKYIDPR